jgi:hypothetical protein
VFTDGRELARITGLPLLGVVSATFDVAAVQRARRHLVWFFGASGGLMGFFALSAGVFYFLASRAG